MPAQEDYQRFNTLAEELGLEGSERDSFVSSAMKRKGYKPTTAWNDPEPEGDNNDENDFFSPRNKGKGQGGSASGGNSGGSGNDSGKQGGGWQY